MRSRNLESGEDSSFCCRVRHDCLEPGKELKYFSSYLSSIHLHLSSCALTPTSRPFISSNHSAGFYHCIPRLSGSGTWRRKTLEIKEEIGLVSASSQFDFEIYS